MLNRDNAIDVVRHRAIAKDPFAMALLEKLNNHTAESILLDAPSRKLSWNLHYAQNRFAYGYGFRKYLGTPSPPDHDIDMSRLKSRKPGSIVRAATEWTAKSASAFSDAIDSTFTEYIFPHQHPLSNPVYRKLRQSHAFDRGNDKYIDLMEDERKVIAREMSYAFWQEIYPLVPLRGDVDSKKSYFIQASDLAGGIASHLYEHGGIFTVTMHFEYVIFNGERISQNDAYETMRKWQEMGYYN